MRDVDLFVSVASIGNDPEWGTRPNAPFLDYWNNISLGELSSSGQQRRQILEGRLPKLAIRDRCRLEDGHLWVRRDRATYKIHLGSGSVPIEQAAAICASCAAAPLRPTCFCPLTATRCGR